MEVNGKLRIAKVFAGIRNPRQVKMVFRRYLECGILARGFSRVRHAGCGHDFLVAFFCAERGVCPSCNSRRMVEITVHIADYIILRLSVRQRVCSVASG